MIEELRNFIFEAKKNTWAGDTEFLTVGNTHTGIYIDPRGKYVYKDEYTGTVSMGGTETVSDTDGNVLWRMSYYGQEYKGYSGEALKYFLRNMNPDYPFRGESDQVYTVGETVYKYRMNKVDDGGINFFSGDEVITMNDVVVFHLYFCGGIVEEV